MGIERIFKRKKLPALTLQLRARPSFRTKSVRHGIQICPQGAFSQASEHTPGTILRHTIQRTRDGARAHDVSTHIGAARLIGTPGAIQPITCSVPVWHMGHLR